MTTKGSFESPQHGSSQTPLKSSAPTSISELIDSLLLFSLDHQHNPHPTQEEAITRHADDLQVAAKSVSNSEDGPSNSSRSEMLLSNHNVGPQSDHVLCQPDHRSAFINTLVLPELPSHTEYTNSDKSPAQKHSGTQLKAEDSEAHKRRRLCSSLECFSIPMPEGYWDSSPTFSIASETVDDYSVQSTHFGSQCLASEVDCLTPTILFGGDYIFNQPNVDVVIATPFLEVGDLTEVEDWSFEEIFHEMESLESLEAQSTSMSQCGSEFVKMSEQMDNKVLQTDPSSNVNFVHVA